MQRSGRETDRGGRVRAHRVRTALTLSAIMAAFVVVAAWNIRDAGFSGYYASAVRSMSLSWRAFWFGAFDPAGTITIDKLAGFLVPQAVSARLFGFSEWSLALPQVVEGVVTVGAVYAIGARWRGAGSGLLAAGAFALTPLLVSMFGHTMEDGLLTMSLALAFAAFQRHLATGRLVPLLLAGLWIGVGFQAKMLQAWFVVPALVVVLLLAVAAPAAVRLGRAALFCGVTLAASLAWMVAVQLVPAADRPYFDGSVSNNVFASVFGYNGVNRFVSGLVPGAAPDFSASVIAAGTDGASPIKLLLPAFTTQVGWFYPLALVGILLSFRGFGSAEVDSRARAMAVGLGGWLFTSVVVLSLSSVPHTAYLAAIVVPVCVFAAVGVSESWGRLRAGRPGLFAALVGAESVWTLGVLVATGLSPAWLLVVVPVCGALAVCAALVGTGIPRDARRVLVTAAAACVAIAASPAVWTVSTLDPALAGTANDAYAGPRTQSVPYFFQTDAPEAARTSFAEFAVGPPLQASPGDVLSDALSVEQRRLVDYVRRVGVSRSPLFTTDSWETAEPYVRVAGLDVGSLGGFSGEVPSPTLESVSARSTSFFLLPADASPDSRPTTERDRIVAHVLDTCTFVPDDVYEGATTLPGQSLWVCGAPGESVSADESPPVGG